MTTLDEFEGKVKSVKGFSSSYRRDLAYSVVFEDDLKFLGIFEENVLVESRLSKGSYFFARLNSPAILLEEIISTVGEPDYFFVGSISSGDISTIEGFFVYPADNIIVVAGIQKSFSDSEALNIFPTGKIAEIYLIAPDKFEEKITELKKNYGMQTYTDIYPWKGYSDLQFDGDNIIFEIILLILLPFYWVGFLKSVKILFCKRELVLPGLSEYLWIIKRIWGEDDIYYNERYTRYINKEMKLFSIFYLVLTPFALLVSSLFLVLIFYDIRLLSFYIP